MPLYPVSPFVYRCLRHFLSFIFCLVTFCLGSSPLCLAQQPDPHWHIAISYTGDFIGTSVFSGVLQHDTYLLTTSGAGTFNLPANGSALPSRSANGTLNISDALECTTAIESFGGLEESTTTAGGQNLQMLVTLTYQPDPGQVTPDYVRIKYRRALWGYSESDTYIGIFDAAATDTGS